VSAPKTAAPVVGYNHNVKYAERVYHVQTEDSGLPHAHFITHLFLGGNIVASMKSSYADNASDPDLPRLIRQLMEQQHKLMLRRLVAGEFNDLAERLAAPHYEPGVLATGQTGPAAVNTSASRPMAAGALRTSAPAKAPTPPPAPPPRAAPLPPPPPQRAVTPSRLPPVPPLPKVPPNVGPRVSSPQSRPVGAPPVWRPSPPTASPSAPAQTRMPGAPLPSTTRGPPAGSKPTVPPRLVPGTPAQPSAARPPPPAAPRSPAAQPKPAQSLFSDAVVEVPADDLPTLFAEELISEKSLDEVILAFLSADLEPPK
jgi:hypothetical protein